MSPPDCNRGDSILRRNVSTRRGHVSTIKSGPSSRGLFLSGAAPARGGLTGSVAIIELHEKRKDTVRDLPWQAVICLKRPADLRLNCPETDNLLPIVLLILFCHVQPFLRHREKEGAHIRIGCVLGQRQALGRKPSSFPRPIVRHATPTPRLQRNRVGG